MGAVIQPEKILRELDELWVSLGKQEEAGGSDGVLRACAMTFLVATEDPSDEAEVGETLASLMRAHPSRAIVLRITGGSALQARVFAQCWMPFGRRQQICCEQVEINCGQGRLQDMSPVVRSLLAPDLPVVLWCRSRPLLDVAEFEPVLRLSSKVILDSAGVPDVRAQVATIHRERAAGRRIGDLAWTRLTRWRESIAQVFDNPVYLACIDEIDVVHIDYEGEPVPISAYYLAGWLRQGLRREPRVEFRRVGEAARARVQTVALRGGGLDVSISVGQDRAVELHAGVHEVHTVFPTLTDCELLREELSVLGRDAIYDEVVRRVAEFLRPAQEE
jgi:glucose-6-phosphate dehydrogenase assembly protein OpcA